LWFEPHDALETALLREKRLKRWRRMWKGALIADRNPLWRDLTDQMPL
jgi:putative endonuclease